MEVIRKRCLTNKRALISPVHLNWEKLSVGSSRLVYESNLIHNSFLWFHGLIALFCSMFCFLQISTGCVTWCGGQNCAREESLHWPVRWSGGDAAWLYGCGDSTGLSCPGCRLGELVSAWKCQNSLVPSIESENYQQFLTVVRFTDPVSDFNFDSCGFWLWELCLGSPRMGRLLCLGS